MKMIITIIKPERLDDVIANLRDKEIRRLTVFEVKGFGQQMGHKEVYRGTEFEVKLNPKVQLEIAINDEFVETTVEAITEGAKSPDGGAIGDGKIFILDMEEAIKIRTGERGVDAI
jgi:nitrogen regulatory protein P-II 2